MLRRDEQTIAVDKEIDKACASGDWSRLGWSPKSSCKCFGSGHRGILRSLKDGVWDEENGVYNLCKCVEKAKPFMVSYFVEGSKNSGGVVDANSKEVQGDNKV